MTIQVVKPKIMPFLHKKKVAAYARVSVEKEASEHSLENQIKVYREYITSRPEWDYVGVYADDAFTGTNTSRPGLQSLLKDCDEGRVDIILTKSISRFARNTVDLLNIARDLVNLFRCMKERTMATIRELGFCKGGKERQEEVSVSREGIYILLLKSDADTLRSEVAGMFKRSTVLRANLEMLFVRMISTLPSLQSLSRLCSPCREVFVPVKASSA